MVYLQRKPDGLGLALQPIFRLFCESPQTFLSTSASPGKCCYVEPCRSLLYSVRFRKAKAENIYVFGGEALTATLPQENSLLWILLLPKGDTEAGSPWRDTPEESHLQKETLFSPLKEANSVLRNRDVPKHILNNVDICKAYTSLNQAILLHSIPNEAHWGKLRGKQWSSCLTLIHLHKTQRARAHTHTFSFSKARKRVNQANTLIAFAVDFNFSSKLTHTTELHSHFQKEIYTPLKLICTYYFSCFAKSLIPDAHRQLHKENQ